MFAGQRRCSRWWRGGGGKEEQWAVEVMTMKVGVVILNVVSVWGSDSVLKGM